MGSLSTDRWRSAGWALVAVAALAAWQGGAVHAGFAGKWNGLYLTGTTFGVPSELAREDVYLVPGNGWDGQFYHIAAHDPFLRTEMWRSIDAPQLRYRRIFVPLLAYILSGGNSAGVDLAYRLVILGWVALGTYWLSRIAIRNGRNPAWGVCFCLVPATLTSLERMSVDVALASLCLALALCRSATEHRWRVYPVLICAAMVRETGLLLTLGWCGWLLIRRQWKDALRFAPAVIPALAWYGYVRSRTPPLVYHAFVSIPFSGLIDRFLHPLVSTLPPAISMLLQTLDYLGLAGMAAGIWLAWRAVRESEASAETAVIALYGLLAVVGWHAGDWAEIVDYGRILSPMLLLLAIRSLRSREWIWSAPILLMLPRLGMQLGSWVYRSVAGTS